MDGRDTIRIVVSADEEYLVDAQTYDPVEWRSKGTAETATLRFVAYEKLPLTPESKDLLDLRAQHPGAKLDADPAHYQDAMGKLFPDGLATSSSCESGGGGAAGAPSRSHVQRGPPSRSPALRPRDHPVVGGATKVWRSSPAAARPGAARRCRPA